MYVAFAAFTLGENVPPLGVADQVPTLGEVTGFAAKTTGELLHCVTSTPAKDVGGSGSTVTTTKSVALILSAHLLLN